MARCDSGILSDRKPACKTSTCTGRKRERECLRSNSINRCRSWLARGPMVLLSSTHRRSCFVREYLRSCVWFYRLLVSVLVDMFFMTPSTPIIACLWCLHTHLRIPSMILTVPVFIRNLHIFRPISVPTVSSILSSLSLFFRAQLTGVDFD